MNLLLTMINNLDIAGIVLLIATLVPFWKLLHELPHGSVRKLWQFLAGMILFFIATYITIAIEFRIHHDFPSREIICIILFLGSIFVLMISILSLRTARDIKRIYTLEMENITDALMNINNRRFLDQKLEEEFLKASRYDLALSVLMIDIDHFKKINDTHGHDTGDQVLKKLGLLIKNVVRESDTVARYGGEEIMVLCPLTDGHHVAWLAERLRHEIEHCSIPVSDTKNTTEIRVTVSIGVAEYTSNILSVTDLVKHADEAMYQAKHQGRNRVTLYDPFSIEA